MKAKAIIHYFSPASNWDWYASEFDGKDTFFGLVSGFELELGYFSLQELESLEIPVNLHFIKEEKVTIVRYKIERDLHWIPKTLEAIWDEHHTLKKLEAA